MMIRALLALLLLTTSLTTSAQSAGSLRVKLNDQTVEFLVEGATPPRALTKSELEAAAQKFITIFKGISAFSQGLRVPERVRMKIAAIEVNPSANTFANVLNLGVRFAQVDEKGRIFTQHPAEMIPVVAHEYAHLIFGANVLDGFPFMRDLRKKLVQAGEIAEIIKGLELRLKKLSEILARGPSPRAEAEVAKTGRELAQWTAEMSELEKEVEPLVTLLKQHTSPYNEYFADVIAVLYTEEPNAVSDSIHFSLPSGTKDRQAKVRTELKNRHFEKRGVDPKHVHSGHGVFHEARFMIWDEYLSRPSVLKNKKNEVAHALVRAIRAELAWKLKTPTLVPIENVRVVNQRLIQRLRAELRDI